jgi:hypothetical protein
MYESFLAIFQVLSGPSEYAAVALSAAMPIGLATGVYAYQNGLRFMPWFMAGFFLPGFSLFPLQSQIKKLEEAKASEKVDFLLKYNPTLKIPLQQNIDEDVLQTVALQDKLASKSTVEENFNINTLDEFYDQANKDEAVQFLESESVDDSGKKIKWIDDEMVTESLKVRFMDTDPTIYKNDAIASSDKKRDIENQVSAFLEYLDGVWLHFDKQKDVLKKAFFRGEKFGLLCNLKSMNIPTEYASYSFEASICYMKLQHGIMPIRVVSADVIFIGNERYVRYRNKKTVKQLAN